MAKIHPDFDEALTYFRWLRAKYALSTKVGQILCEAEFQLAKAGATAADKNFITRTGLTLLMDDNAAKTRGVSPCPFCGSADISERKKHMACDNCGAEGPYETPDNLDAWNQRVRRAAPSRS